MKDQCWFQDICSDGKTRCHFEMLILGALSCDNIEGKSCPPEETPCPDENSS